MNENELKIGYENIIYPWTNIDTKDNFWKRGTFKDHFNATYKAIGSPLGDEMKKIFVEQCREKWKLYKDLLSDCTIYDIETMDNCTDYKIWNDAMNEARLKNIVLSGREPFEKRKTISIFDKYSMDTLKDLYSRDSICTITQYFIDEFGKRNYNGHVLINPEMTGEGVMYSLNEQNARFEYSNGKEKTKAYERKLETRIKASELIKLLLYDKNIGNDGYDFVIQHLQFATLEDLKCLMKLAEKNFIIRKPGKPIKNVQIGKYDKDGTLLTLYKDRKECMKRENISKSALTNVLSGKRKTCKGYLYEEVPIPKD